MVEIKLGKRSRKGGPRAKTGCRTCKIRHVKCDEHKPHCANCTSTGRLCDGYLVQTVSSHHLVLWEGADSCTPMAVAGPWCDSQVTLASILGLPSGGQSGRLYHNFLHQVLPALSESLDAAFWQADVLRNSASRPAVQHAAITLGAVYQLHMARLDDEAHGRPHKADPGLEISSVRWYHAAIRSLRERITQSSFDDDELIEEAMTACLLLVCIEILRGCDVYAVAHLEGALSILLNLHQPRASGGSTPTTRDNTTLGSTMDSLTRIYTRLDIQAASYIGSRASRCTFHSLLPHPALEDPDYTFSSLLEARSCLNTHLTSILSFTIPPYGAAECFPGWTPHPENPTDQYSVFHGSTYRDFPMAPAQANAARRHFTKRLSSWKLAFQKLLQRADVPHKPEDRAECALIWLSFYTTRIKLLLAYTADEVLYDAQLPGFRKIVDQAEVFRKCASGGPLLDPEGAGAGGGGRRLFPKRRDMSIHMGVTYPLYFAALKCRYGPVRQRALALLRGSGVESVWDGEMLARVVDHVVETEGVGLGDADLELEKDFGIPEERRIHCVALNIDKDHKRLWIQCNRRVGEVTDSDLEQNSKIFGHWRIDQAVLYW